MDLLYRSLRDRASWRDYELHKVFQPKPDVFGYHLRWQSHECGFYRTHFDLPILITSIYHLLIDFIYHVNGDFRITLLLIFRGSKKPKKRLVFFL